MLQMIDFEKAPAAVMQKIAIRDHERVFIGPELECNLIPPVITAEVDIGIRPHNIVPYLR
jgi:hypothetical protein